VTRSWGIDDVGDDVPTTCFVDDIASLSFVDDPHLRMLTPLQRPQPPSSVSCSSSPSSYPSSSAHSCPPYMLPHTAHRIRPSHPASRLCSAVSCRYPFCLSPPSSRSCCCVRELGSAMALQDGCPITGRWRLCLPRVVSQKCRMSGAFGLGRRCRGLLFACTRKGCRVL
jgi:hypothetical protein